MSRGWGGVRSREGARKGQHVMRVDLGLVVLVPALGTHEPSQAKSHPSLLPRPLRSGPTIAISQARLTCVSAPMFSFYRCVTFELPSIISCIIPLLTSKDPARRRLFVSEKLELLEKVRDPSKPSRHRGKGGGDLILAHDSLHNLAAFVDVSSPLRSRP